VSRSSLTGRGQTGDGDSSRFDLGVDVEEWAVQEAWTGSLEENITLAADEQSGTTIEVTKIHPSVQDDLNDPSVAQLLRAELRVRHQESIQSGLKLYLNSETALIASRPSLQSSAVVQPVYKHFQVEASGGSVDIKLYAGTVSPPKHVKGSDLEDEGQAENFQDAGDAGWYLFCNDRLLLVADRTPITGWGNPAAAYHPQYRLFRGFVYLSADDAGLLPWNTTKTAVDRDSPIFRAVQSEMKTALVAVQAVINRAKQVRARFDEEETKPDILLALDDTPDQPISSLTTLSSNMIAPASPPPKPYTPATPKIQRIQYTVEPQRYKEVAEVLGASSGSEVGRLTFDYFYEQEID